MSNITAEEHPIKGQRNLFILGVAAIIIALATTGIELIIYHNSGDIYLDRSRPEYLPEPGEEASSDSSSSSSSYAYSSDTAPSAKNLDTYLSNLKALQAKINQVESPYSADALSDASLGIGTEASESPAE